MKTVVMKDLTEKRIVEMRGLIEEKTVEMKSPIEERTEEMIEERTEEMIEKRTEEMIEKIVRMIEEVVKAKVKIEKMKKGVVMIASNQLKAKIQSNRIRLKLNSALWILDALICSSILKRMVKKLA